MLGNLNPIIIQFSHFKEQAFIQFIHILVHIQEKKGISEMLVTVLITRNQCRILNLLKGGGLDIRFWTFDSNSYFEILHANQ